MSTSFLRFRPLRMFSFRGWQGGGEERQEWMTRDVGWSVCRSDRHT